MVEIVDDDNDDDDDACDKSVQDCCSSLRAGPSHPSPQKEACIKHFSMGAVVVATRSGCLVSQGGNIGTDKLGRNGIVNDGWFGIVNDGWLWMLTLLRILLLFLVPSMQLLRAGW
jgi:hypothetical protein